VPIRIVLADGRQGVHADLQRPLASTLEVRVVDDGVHHSGELVSQEDGEHGGRGLLGAQPVVVAGEGHRGPQELLIVIHTLDEGRQ
ncbi:HNH endonuclease, partial [Dysosmobacter welbionis]